MKLAEAADNSPLLPEDMDVTKELKCRQDRLAVIAKAKQEIHHRFDGSWQFAVAIR